MDRLKLLRGKSHEICDFLKIRQPLIGEIEEYGEKKYWNLVQNICSTSYDHRFMLDDKGIDYEDVDDFSIFCMVMPSFSVDDTKIIFGDEINFQDFEKMYLNDDPVLYNSKKDILISEITYELLVSFLRESHGLKRNYKIAGNKMARRYRMVEERKQWEESLTKPQDDSSFLEPLISALVNCADFKYNYDTVWDLPLYTFLNAVSRIQNTVNHRNLMLGIYTGNIDSKSISQKQLNWLGELNK